MKPVIHKITLDLSVFDRAYDVQFIDLSDHPTVDAPLLWFMLGYLTIRNKKCV